VRTQLDVNFVYRSGALEVYQRLLEDQKLNLPFMYHRNMTTDSYQIGINFYPITTKFRRDEIIDILKYRVAEKL